MISAIKLFAVVFEDKPNWTVQLDSFPPLVQLREVSLHRVKEKGAGASETGRRGSYPTDGSSIGREHCAQMFFDGTSTFLPRSCWICLANIGPPGQR